MIIDGVDYTLLRDYDRGKYHFLDFSGKVTYLSARVDLILIAPCKFYVAAAASKQDGGMGLIVATGICAMISAASTFLNGGRAKGQDKTSFLDFVNKYMPQLDSPMPAPSSGTWAEWLYSDVRCGLAHGFTIESGGIEEDPTYLRQTVHGPEVSLSLLLDDFERGWSRYLSDVKCDGPSTGLGLLFDSRFNAVFHD